MCCGVHIGSPVPGSSDAAPACGSRLQPARTAVTCRADGATLAGMRARLPWLLLLVVGALSACGDDDGGTTPGTDGGGGGDTGVMSDGGAPPPPPGDMGPADGAAPGEGGAGEGGMMGNGAASIRHDCAPDDGPALRMIVARAGTDCMPDTDGEHLTFYVFAGLPITAPQTVMLDPAGASAALCPGATAPCTDASGGSLTFDAYDDTRASGTFSIMVEEQLLEGTFDAVFCGDPPMCG